jgi:hypothetical protein
MCYAGRKATEKLEVACRVAATATLLAMKGREIGEAGRRLPHFEKLLRNQNLAFTQDQFNWTTLGMCATAFVATLEHFLTRRAPIDLLRVRGSTHFQGLDPADETAIKEVCKRLAPTLKGGGLARWQGRVQEAFDVTIDEPHALTLHSVIYHRHRYAHDGLAVPPHVVPANLLVAWSQAVTTLGRLIANANPARPGIMWR